MTAQPPPDPADLSADIDGTALPETIGAVLRAGAGTRATPDPVWVSLVRGRLLAALTAGCAAWISARALWDQVGAIRAEGLTPEHAAALLAHAQVSLDAWTALGLATLNLIAMAAAGLSWVRGRRRRRTGGA